MVYLVAITVCGHHGIGPTTTATITTFGVFFNQATFLKLLQAATTKTAKLLFN